MVYLAQGSLGPWALIHLSQARLSGKPCGIYSEDGWADLSSSDSSTHPKFVLMTTFKKYFFVLFVQLYFAKLCRLPISHHQYQFLTCLLLLSTLNITQKGHWTPWRFLYFLIHDILFRLQLFGACLVSSAWSALTGEHSCSSTSL